MPSELTEKQKESIEWIISIFNKRDIPFQIAGGLAAKIYGSTRPLNDIDIDVPEERISEIIEDVEEYITFGPKRDADGKWDLYVLALKRNGQDFDISGAENVKIFDDAQQIWKDFPSDVKQATWVDFLGMKLPVIPKEELIAYKSLLNGAHQKEDIEAVSRS